MWTDIAIWQIWIFNFAQKKTKWTWLESIEMGMGIGIGIASSNRNLILYAKETHSRLIHKTQHVGMSQDSVVFKFSRNYVR